LAAFLVPLRMGEVVSQNRKCDEDAAVGFGEIDVLAFATAFGRSGLLGGSVTIRRCTCDQRHGHDQSRRKQKVQIYAWHSLNLLLHSTDPDFCRALTPY